MNDERFARREARYQLRASLRRVTSLARLRSCGLPLGDALVIKQKRDFYYFANVSTCGSAWACPVCASKIRYYRAQEVSRAIVTALQQGMGVLLVTRTVPHSAEDRLSTTLHLLAEGKRYVTNQPKVKAARKAAAYLGSIAAKEITYGACGWHPHSHDVEILAQEVSLEQFATLNALYYDYLDRFYSAHGYEGLSRLHGVQIEQVTLGGGALAAYLAKARRREDVHLYAAQEVTRVDLKQGRAGSLMPFELAAAFFATGDMAFLDLWHEYEAATFGKSAIRFTENLRRRLLADLDLTDPEVAARQVKGVPVVELEHWLYRKLSRVPYLEGKVLTALDTGGFAALVELLTAYQLDEPGGYWQVEQAEC